jgi:hypothetical protein
MKELSNLEQTNRYLDPYNKTNENRLLQLQQFARNRVIEPFEGRKSLETLQKTRTKIEKGINRIRTALNKTGDWVSESEIANQSKAKVSGLVQDFKSSSSQRRLSGVANRLDKPTKRLKQLTKSTYAGIEERARNLARDYIKRGLETVLIANDESRILKRVNRILDGSEFTALSQLRDLTPEQRNALIKNMYPYDSARYREFASKFDLSVNVSLGAIVATNFPGTGIAVSLVNMAKTVVKLGNRLKIMSAIYGFHLTNAHALFKASTQILKSMSDWETNPNHLPLDPDILNDLYSAEKKDDPLAFQEMMDAIVKKDAYIAIPGVGSISLGKISLDDIKMDLVVKQLVIDHFTRYEFMEDLEMDQAVQILGDFELIYTEFKSQNFFSSVRKAMETEHLTMSDKKWKENLKAIVGFDLTLDDASLELDHHAFEIFKQIRNFGSEKKANFIRETVKNILENMT